jgi:hypothetical protein
MNAQIARQLLTNMPDEVFNLYIEPLIKLHGWPFHSVDSPTFGLWFQMFDHHSLKTISELIWERQEITFSLRIFHRTSQDRIVGIVNTHVHGMNTPFANVINAKARFDRCRTYIARTGRMPVPVVLMRDFGGLRILDGNHRLAAMASFSNSHIGIVDCWIGSLNVELNLGGRA